MLQYMNDHYEKYAIYKRKYINLKRNKLRDPNFKFSDVGYDHNVKSNAKQNREKSQMQIKSVNVNDVTIPEKYINGSLIFKANQDFIAALDKFNEYVDMFQPKNSKLLQDKSTDKNFYNGILDVQLNNGDKYELEAVPFMTRNLSTGDGVCWSWVDSAYGTTPGFDDKVNDFHQKYKKIIGQVPHLNFDCLSGLKTNEQKFNFISYDMAIIGMYLLGGIAIFNTITPKIQGRNYETQESHIITKITKVN